jgi:hypothetical protein
MDFLIINGSNTICEKDEHTFITNTKPSFSFDYEEMQFSVLGRFKIIQDVVTDLTVDEILEVQEYFNDPDDDHPDRIEIIQHHEEVRGEDTVI